MAAKYLAKDIAQWFINKACEEVGNGGEYITHLKLQKLLYYAQGVYGVIKKEPLFNEKIYCWSHGPVVKKVYDVYCHYGHTPISEKRMVKIDDETTAILNEVYKVFGQYTAWALREKTHEEDPWKSVELNEEISFSSIYDYFKNNIVVE